MRNRVRSLVFDFFQVGGLVLILLTGPVIASGTVLKLFQALAILILVDAAWRMRRTQYYRVPDVGKQAELVKSGIYRYVRNPMYLAQLLFCGTLIISSFSVYRLLVYLLYVVNFIFKIRYEEVLLTFHFKEFAAYKRTSWRLIPFVY